MRLFGLLARPPACGLQRNDAVLAHVPAFDPSIQTPPQCRLLLTNAQRLPNYLLCRNVALPAAHQLHMTKPAAAPAAATDVTPDEAAAEAAEASEQQPEGAAAESEQAGAQPPAAAAEQQQQQQDKKPRAVLGDALTLDQLKSLTMGCCVALLRPEDAAALDLGYAEGDADDSGLVAAAPFSIACWRGRASINILVSKQEAAQMIERITEARAKLAGAAGQPSAAAAAEAAAEPVAA